MRTFPAALTLALTLAACGDPATVTPRSDSSPSAPAYAAADLVVRVTYVGGFVPQEHNFRQIPVVAVYGDGRVFTLGAQPAIYPGKAYPPVLVARVDAAALRRIVDEGVQAGVDGEQRDYGQPPVADAANTEITLRRDGRLVTTSVYALGMNDDGGPLTADQQQARARLKAYVDKLTGLEQWLGDGTVTDDAPYDAGMVAILARPYTLQPDTGVTPEERLWRGPDPAAGVDVAGQKCITLSGPALAAVEEDLRAATTITRWKTVTGKVYAFMIRPLLPDETECGDLAYRS